MRILFLLSVVRWSYSLYIPVFLCYTVKYIIGFSPGVTSVERRTAVKQDRDLRSIIKSHQEEMTELELDIARYFFIS